MNGNPAPLAFTSQRFREILGQYPTGVTAVTAVAASGRGVGLALGSFTSVSLQPPLVAFLADKSSTSWPKIEAAGTFCVNVLGADQEDVCRMFASKAADKFAGFGWRPATSGSPIIDGAVAWFDCDLEVVHEAGDHYIVIGRVRDLDVARYSLPLLFFRGGYGSFTPMSFAAIDADLLDQLRFVDLARPAMEGLATEVGAECTAALLVGNELVNVARAGRLGGGAGPTRVGRRLPFTPPVGAAFVAWAESTGVDLWLRQLDHESYERQAHACRALIERIRSQGYSTGFGHREHLALSEVLGELPVSTHEQRQLQRVDQVVLGLLAGYDQRELRADSTYELRTISAPVFGPKGGVVLQLTLHGFSDQSNGVQIEAYAARLLCAAREATEAVGGRMP